MNKRTLSAVTLAALISAGFAVAAGQNDAPKHGDMPPPHMQGEKAPQHQAKNNKNGLPRGFDRLNLSAAQKAQIKTIMEKNRPAEPTDHSAKREEFRQRIQQRRNQETALLSAKTFNEQAARQMIAERQQERASLERNHAENELAMLKTRHAVFQVLTPAQQKQYLDNEKQFEQRMQQGQAPAPR